MPGSSALIDGVRQRHRRHPVVGIAVHRNDGVGPETENGSRFLQAEVSDSRGQDAEARGLGREPLLLDAVPVEPHQTVVVPGQQQGHQVGLRPAAGENPVCPGIETDPPGRPIDEVLLDQCRARALVPGIDRRIHRRSDELRCHRRIGDGAVQVRHVARMMEIHRVMQIQLFEFIERRFERRQRLVEPDGFERGRQLGR